MGSSGYRAAMAQVVKKRYIVTRRALVVFMEGLVLYY
jgi:hypothetical protein